MGVIKILQLLSSLCQQFPRQFSLRINNMLKSNLTGTGYQEAMLNCQQFWSINFVHPMCSGSLVDSGFKVKFLSRWPAVSVRFSGVFQSVVQHVQFAHLTHSLYLCYLSLATVWGAMANGKYFYYTTEIEAPKRNLKSVQTKVCSVMKPPAKVSFSRTTWEFFSTIIVKVLRSHPDTTISRPLRESITQEAPDRIDRMSNEMLMEHTSLRLQKALEEVGPIVVTIASKIRHGEDGNKRKKVSGSQFGKLTGYFLTGDCRVLLTDGENSLVYEGNISDATAVEVFSRVFEKPTDSNFHQR